MPCAVRHRAVPPTPTRRHVALTMLLCAALCVVTGAIGVPSAAAFEKVATGSAYGDFEDPHLDPVGWGVGTTGPNQVYTSTTVAMSGARSLYVDDTSTSDAVSVMRKVQRVSPYAEYHLQAYAFVKSGDQRLAMRFVDENNRILSRVEVPTPDATMIWSRVYVRAKAPAGAVAVTAEISSSKAGRGTVWWDTVELQISGVANSGFEKTDRTDPAPDWTTSAPAGTTVSRSTADSVLGRHSIETVDSSASTAFMMRTTPKRVFPSAAQNVRIWIKPTSGQFTATVRFYDSAMREVQSSQEPIRASAGRWNLYRRQVVPPVDAIWATIEFASTTAGTGSALWDAIDLRPTPDAGVHTYSQGTSVQPVEQISNATVVTALVAAGRAKLVGIVSGDPAELQVLDVQKGTLEQRIPLGGMNVGWGLAKGHDGAVYLGGNDGHLWRWTPGAASVVDLGRASDRAATVWDLDVSSDGKVWGVSYPDAQIWSYDPATSAFSAATTVATGQEYARSLAIVGTSAYVGVGSTNPEIVELSLGDRSRRSTIALPSPVTSGNIAELDALGSNFLAVKTPSGQSSGGLTVSAERRLFDLRNRTWAVNANYSVQKPSEADADGAFYYVKYRQLTRVDQSGGETLVGPVGLLGGRDKLLITTTLGGTPGTWLLSYTPGESLGAVEVSTLEEKSFPLDFGPTPLHVKTLARSGSGFLAGGFGAPSLTSLGPDLAVEGHYPYSTSGAESIGEVEGSITNGGVQYIGTYTGSKIFRYDPAAPWQDGTNPQLVAELGASHLQDRPLAWAASGPRTFFGTVPKYGTLGGVLGIIDHDGATPRIVAEPVPDQSVVSLAAQGSVVYGGTSRWGGLGATPTQASAKVFAYDAATSKLLWSVVPQAGVEAYGAMLVTPDGSLWAASGTTLVQIDPATGAVVRSLDLQTVGPQPTPTLRNAAMDYADGLLYLTAAGRVYVVDLVSLRVDVPVKTGVTAFQIVAGDGRFVVPMGTELREFLVH